MSLTLLPGTDKQLNYLFDSLSEYLTPALFIGTGNEVCALKYAKKTNTPVEHIVEDYTSMINAKLIMVSEKMITTRIMDFSKTDFNNESFQLVYAQASTSNPHRNKIVKEVRRVLKTGGLFCVGEIIATNKKLPVYVNDIIEASELNLISQDAIHSYYESRNFTVVSEIEQKKGLDEYYNNVYGIMKDTIKEMDEQELKYNKRLIKKAKHETEAYLKLGLDKYINFKTLILRKNESEEK